MNHSTKYPATVRELGDMAHERGMSAVELLEELGPLPWPPTAPASAISSLA